MFGKIPTCKYFFILVESISNGFLKNLNSIYKLVRFPVGSEYYHSNRRQSIFQQPYVGSKVFSRHYISCLCNTPSLPMKIRIMCFSNEQRQFAPMKMLIMRFSNEQRQLAPMKMLIMRFSNEQRQLACSDENANNTFFK